MSRFWLHSEMVVFIFALFIITFTLYLVPPTPCNSLQKGQCLHTLVLSQILTLLCLFHGSLGWERLWGGWRGGGTNEVFLFYYIQVLHHLWVKNAICTRLCKLQWAGLSHNCTISQSCSNPLTHICWQWSKIRWPLFKQCVCDDAQQSSVLYKHGGKMALFVYVLKYSLDLCLSLCR